MANKSKSSKKPTLKSQIESLQNEIKEEKDKFLRLFAEFENYKKRTSKERLDLYKTCLLYTSPSPRDRQKSRMPSSA